jgi:cytochrome c2
MRSFSRLLGIALTSIALTACARAPTYRPEILEGNAAQGRLAIRRYECNVCHEIPGTAAFQGRVGPSLANYRRNLYVAGKFPNDAQSLTQWIIDPPQLAPATAMPNIGVSPIEARDIVAYLYSLD